MLSTFPCLFGVRAEHRSSFVGGNTGQHYGHGGHGGYGDYNYHQGGYHDGYQASHHGHHQQSHHGHHQHGGNSGHHGYDAHDRGYQNYDPGYENYQVDQGYDQSNGPEPGDAKPIPDGEPMSIVSEGGRCIFASGRGWVVVWLSYTHMGSRFLADVGK